MPTKIQFDRDQLYDLYIIQNKSADEVAETLEVSRRPVLKALSEFGIVKSPEMARKKREETNLNRYGCTNVSSSEAVKAKTEQTNLKRYGCKNPAQSDLVKDKIRQTNFDRYNVESTGSLPRATRKKKDIDEEILRELYIEQGLHIQEVADLLGTSGSIVQARLKEYHIRKSSKELLAQRETTNLKKYGVKSTGSVPEFQEKREATCIEKYGTPYPSTTEAVKIKTQNTCQKKYGVKNAMQNADVFQKALATFKQHFGENRKPGQTNVSDDSLEITSSKEKLEKFMVDNNIHTVRELTSRLGRSSTHKIGTLLHQYDLWHLINTNESAQENEITRFVRGLGVRCYRDRSVLAPFEIDCYCPDHNIGIEFNGTYWHSSLHKDKKYHFQKSLRAEEAGIRLIHIYEYEWEDERIRPILESMLKIAFGKISTKIYARNCTIRKITNAEAKPFNNANHLQGHRNANLTYGLFYNDQLVQLMSFSHNRKYEWEIIRGCPGSNNIVVGGVSKLFAHFVKENNPSEVFSYADFNKFDGSGYLSLGMKFIGYTGPDLKWIINGEVYDRNPHKHKIMKELADAKIWGSGSKKFLWNKNKNES